MIRFTQYLRPDGRKIPVDIDMPPPIEHLALQFIKAGGRYEVEELPAGIVSLTAVHQVCGQDDDIAIELCPNGPAIPLAVEKLVRASIAWLDRQ